MPELRPRAVGAGGPQKHMTDVEPGADSRHQRLIRARRDRSVMHGQDAFGGKRRHRLAKRGEVVEQQRPAGPEPRRQRIGVEHPVPVGQPTGARGCGTGKRGHDFGQRPGRGVQDIGRDHRREFRKVVVGKAPLRFGDHRAALCQGQPGVGAADIGHEAGHGNLRSARNADGPARNAGPPCQPRYSQNGLSGK